MARASIDAVRSHWEEEPCGTRGLDPNDRRAFFKELEDRRTQAEPYIEQWAGFAASRGKRVLEIGVGTGTDFVRWARAGADAYGVDLTAAGVALTRERLALEGLPAQVHQADAERLPFTDNQFDVVYSYGVLHHTPDTLRSIDELHRVLQPGGRAVVMLYQYPSWSVGWIWLRQGLLRGRLRLTPREAVARYLESPGTKVFTRSEVRLMFHWADELTLRSEVAAGDTFDIDLSGKYRSPVDRVLMCVARLVVAPVVRRSGRRWGLNLLITARKPPRTTA